jgi:hypothetical protein
MVRTVHTKQNARAVRAVRIIPTVRTISDDDGRAHGTGTVQSLS